MSPAPIALFTYNRPVHTRLTINALAGNNLASESELYIFSDGIKNEQSRKKVEETRAYLKTITGFKQVTLIEREENFGLAKNIIAGVSEILSSHGKLIVLEDDLVTSPHFLLYMNQGLSLYENNPEVISIHGYTYPVRGTLPETFFLKGADCLGWGTWKSGWELFSEDSLALREKIISHGLQSEFDFNNTYPYLQMLTDQAEGKSSSWAIRWYASAFLNNKYTLYPSRSLINHIGGDGSGTNVGFDDLLATEVSPTPVEVVSIPVIQLPETYELFCDFFRRLRHPPLSYRFRRKLFNLKKKLLAIKPKTE